MITQKHADIMLVKLNLDLEEQFTSFKHGISTM